MSDDPLSSGAPGTPVEPDREKSPKPWFLTTRFVVTVASVLVLAIVGTVIGVSAHNASSVAQQAAAKRAEATSNNSSLDCAEYAKLSDSRRKAEADALAPPPVNFTATGALPPAAMTYYDSACNTVRPKTSLVTLSNEIAKKTPKYPSCADFLKLPVSVQNSWSAVVWQLIGSTEFTLDATQQTPALVVGCQAPDAIPDATLQDSARSLNVFMMTHTDSDALASYLAGQADTVPIPTATPTPATGVPIQTVQLESQGYTISVTMGFTLGRWTKSDEYDSPGFASAGMNSSFSASVTNTTAGRFTIVNGELDAVALYLANSPACQANSDFAIQDPGYVYTTSDGKYCIVPIQNVLLPSNLTPDQTAPATADPFKTYAGIGLSSVPEDQLSALEAQVDAPFAYLILLDSQVDRSGVMKLDWQPTGESPCLFTTNSPSDPEAGRTVVASSSGFACSDL